MRADFFGKNRAKKIMTHFLTHHKNQGASHDS